jgi:DNA polymerase I
MLKALRGRGAPVIQVLGHLGGEIPLIFRLSHRHPPAAKAALFAWELKRGRKIRMWRDEFGDAPPYAIDPDALFVSFHASTEIGCHLALDWPKPARILDLRAEFRNHTNGLSESVTPSGKGLIGALTYYRLDSISAVEKDAMRDLILRGGPWSEQERQAILDYCETDVDALARLLPRMLPLILDRLDLGRALLRAGSWRQRRRWSISACRSTFRS